MQSFGIFLFFLINYHYCLLVAVHLCRFERIHDEHKEIVEDIIPSEKELNEDNLGVIADNEITQVSVGDLMGLFNF